ncbi:MAG: FecR family protein [Candidatus Cryptobacteroides sp.]
MKQMKDPVSVAGEIVRDIGRMESIDTEKALRDVNRRIRRRTFFRIAAGITAVASIVLAVTLFLMRDNAPAAFTAESGPGQSAEVKLPDETTVLLYPDTRLSYSSDRSGQRTVAFRGKARFEVSADKDRPFVVNTEAGLSVKVHGTVFEVDAYPDSPTVGTVLHKGIVSVSAAGMSDDVLLKPGQKLTYETATRMISVETISELRTPGHLVFNHASIEDILDSFAVHFRIDINIDNKSGREDLYHAAFEIDNTIDEAMKSLSELTGIGYNFTESNGRRILNVTI